MPLRKKEKTNRSHSEIVRKIDMINKGKNENKEAKSPRVKDEPKIADKKSDDSQNTATKVKLIGKVKKPSSKNKTVMKKPKIVKKEKKLKPSKALELEESKRFQEKLNEAKQEDDQKKLSLTRWMAYQGNVLSEKTGFGWNGLGSRKIIFDDKIKETCYVVIEPELSKEEQTIKDRLIYYFRVRADIDVFGMNDKTKRVYLEEILNKIIKEKHIDLKGEAKDRVFYYIFQEFFGYSKIDILMNDVGIEDISCDGIDVPIFIFHKDYESIRSNIIYTDADELSSFVVKLSQLCGKQISVYSPIVDGKLEDGSRLQTTLGNTITRYSTFTIRRFREDPLTPIDLIENNTMSIDMAAYFWMVIEKGTSILFCGGTASGKTTALNALSLFLPSTFKIVSIEDTREINLPHENWIAGTTRTGFAATEDFKTGKDIDMFDLIRVALRQRPKVIIVGEVRGKEAYTLFQAMTTGHLSYSTIHAGDMHTLIQRLENKPIDLPRALLTSLDLIVFLNSVTVAGAPVRRITSVTEVIKLDPATNRLVTLIPFSWISETKDEFENAGGSRIIDKIKLQNGWSASRVKQELENRKKILQWMMKKDLRSYEAVGRVVSEYTKDPDAVLKKAKEDT